VEGITRETIGQGDAYSIYDFEGAQKTWQGLQAFGKKGGRGVFADTYTKHKCGGAPKKICLLTDDYLRKNGTRDASDFSFYTAAKELYDVPHYTPRLLEIYKERKIPIGTQTRLTGVDTAAKKAFFVQTSVTDGITKTEKFTKDYDFLHFTPPQTAPDFVRQSGLSWTEGPLAAEGWAQIKRDLAAETYRLYVLDEFTYPISWGWVDVDEVVEVLADRPGQQHVVITGRDAHPRLLGSADLVTEMNKIRHPMDGGQKGQKGIEW